MLRTTLAQVRAHAGRMVASCLAIAIAVAFLVTTLALTATSEQAVLDAVAGRFASSGAVISDVSDEVVTDQSALDAGAVARARELLAARPGIAAVTDDMSVSVELRVPGEAGRQVVPAQKLTPPGPLRWQRVSAGRLPEADGEVAVTSRTGASPGDVVTITPELMGDLMVPRAQPVPTQVRVVGIVDLGADPTAGVRGQVFATPAQTAAWATAGLGTPVPAPQRLRVAAAEGTSPQQLVTEVRSVLAGDPATVALLVITGDEAAQLVADAYSGEAAGLSAVLLVFAVIALLVAGLVIANTFAVVLAQRTQELALLRCVGATTAQVLRSVLAEAVVVGLGASLIGAGAGLVLAAGASLVLSAVDSPVPLGAVVVPVGGVALSIVVGAVVTILAALVPARAATRVAPLAALRPLDPAPTASRGGRLRLAVGLGLLAPSVAGLVQFGNSGRLAPTVAAGTVSFLAVVLVAQRTLPPVVGLTGRLAARIGGIPAALAAANSVRNPRRTAATATALLIGVTLTASVVVGAATTRATTTAQLDAQYPVDATVSAEAPLPAALADRLAAVPGVGATTVTLGGAVTWKGEEVQALGVDPAAAAATLRSTSSSPMPKTGTVVVDEAAAGPLGIVSGDLLELAGPSGTRTLTARSAPSGSAQFLLAAADLVALDAGAATREVWVRMDAGLDDAAQTAVVDDLTHTAAALAPTSSVVASATERQALDRIVGLLLLVMTGLLGVAVLIAVLGVGNTLALSVVERRQESGLLRALGLTRRQLGATLVWEAVLVAGVASLLGCALGVLYGATGSSAVLSGIGEIEVAVPWLTLTGIVAVGALAGAIASLLPARRAARTSPVAALAP